jgi:UDP-N-acetylmuramoyl-L-alanyl-D-glutamate--2,6-diaminopimelate ligase
MASVAEQGADRLFITADNPRSEPPEAIIEQMLAGLSEAGRARAVIEPDRRAAIALAVQEARGGDIILIAGKGHETHQIIGQERRDFDDVAVAAGLMRTREQE